MITHDAKLSSIMFEITYYYLWDVFILQVKGDILCLKIIYENTLYDRYYIVIFKKGVGCNTG